MTLHVVRRAARFALLFAFSACAAPSPSPPAPNTTASSVPVAPIPLAFSIDAGALDNHFVRSGSVAAHVVAASGSFPRVLFAFPAGDTGAGLWFEGLETPAHMDIEGPVVPVTRGSMSGASAIFRVGAPSLRVRGAVLGSIRALRQYTLSSKVPEGFESRLDVDRGAVLSRTMLDGKRISLTIEPLSGATVDIDETGNLRASASPGESTFAIRATALTESDPLTPIAMGSLLASNAAPDPQSRDALGFLAYREKLLAGSWRFLTYFGRDTLITLQMLMPALGAAPIEAGLGSVIERLGPQGQVAHEESIGEWAVIENRAKGRAGAALRDAVYDYSMVDDDFLLAPAIARYLLDMPLGRARAAAFLAQRGASGATYREALAKNFDRVIALAAPFAISRQPRDLIALLPETRAGNWRDSDNGLGGGRVPYDVNAALVPAALDAIARLSESPRFPGRDASRVRSIADAWRSSATMFRVEISESEAHDRIAAYAAHLGLDASAALASVVGPVVFDSIALDASLAPIPIEHSDVAFTWLYDAPPSHDVERAARRLFAPFPAGLVTPVGVVVANPVFAADSALRGMFTQHDYHGTVVWSWQQALVAAGIVHQLARTDLDPSARRALEDAEVILWKLIRGTQAKGLGTAELWSFGVNAGKIHLVPFGEGRGDADESNAVQLWSTVFLAVRPSWEVAK